MDIGFVEATFNYDQIPAGYYDQVARRGSGIQCFWHHYKFKFLIDRIAKTEKRELNVLDFGCGPGTFLGMLGARLPIRGTGVDVAQAQVDYANRTYGTDRIQFVCSLIEDPQIVQLIRSADIVSLIEVIEHMHLRDAQHLLGLLRDHMKPGARLLITTPNYVSFWPVLELLVGWCSKVNYEEQHILKFNRFKLRAILVSFGFSKIEIGTFLHVSPFVAGFFGRTFGALIEKIESPLIRLGGPLLYADVTR